jgi:hypothetical protein
MPGVATSSRQHTLPPRRESLAERQARQKPARSPRRSPKPASVVDVPSGAESGELESDALASLGLDPLSDDGRCGFTEEGLAEGVVAAAAPAPRVVVPSPVPFRIPKKKVPAASANPAGATKAVGPARGAVRRGAARSARGRRNDRSAS